MISYDGFNKGICKESWIRKMLIENWREVKTKSGTRVFGDLFGSDNVKVLTSYITTVGNDYIEDNIGTRYKLGVDKK